ncbi:MAG: AcrR family transcriptional regulator [Halioglobus sp.]|jgi:AcrR family transcriptional regulator
MSDTNTRPSTATIKRRTQAQRRTESRQAVLDSACRLFGQKGYADTSLGEIASDCGLTIRPIYHYFSNKKTLFSAVNEVMEERIIASMKIGNKNEPGAGVLENWRAYLDLCDDPAFRRIVLVDSPNILGRERWSTSPVTEKARAALEKGDTGDQAQQYRTELMNAVVMGAFTEAALMIADAQDIDMAKREAEEVMLALFEGLRGRKN